MSRIQNILEKAERDGAVHRLHVAGDSAAPAAFAVDTLQIDEPPVETTAGTSEYRVVSGAHVSQRVTAALSNGPAAEQYRALRTRIMHADNGAAVNVLLVTSPGRGEGKSLTAANLALAMAQEYQRRICLVDTNLRAPQVHGLFGIPEEPGLTDVLAGHATLDDAVVMLDEPRIAILPAGSGVAHPAELLGTTIMRRALDTLRRRFDCVVMDAPSAVPLADVRILAPLVDGVVVVVRAGVTAKPAVHDAIAALDPGKVLGIVLNDAVA
jgi:capsular exopolysaccharide synthesis family protein